MKHHLLNSKWLFSKKEKSCFRNNKKTIWFEDVKKNYCIHFIVWCADNTKNNNSLLLNSIQSDSDKRKLYNFFFLLYFIHPHPSYFFGNWMNCRRINFMLLPFQETWIFQRVSIFVLLSIVGWPGDVSEWMSVMSHRNARCRPSIEWKVWNDSVNWSEGGSYGNYICHSCDIKQITTFQAEILQFQGLVIEWIHNCIDIFWKLVNHLLIFTFHIFSTLRRGHND